MHASVLIVDDHAPFRAIARELLANEGFNVVGEATDGQSGIEAAATLSPDVVLLDVQLPDVDGFTVARAIAGRSHRPTVVMTSSRDASDYEDRLAASRCPFIPKSELSGPRLTAALASRR